MIDSTVVIKLNEISKKYKLFDDKKARMKEALHPLKKQYHKDFYALNNINLEVRKGEILGIVGMNGSGKSTLLKIISGIIQPSEGTISVSGHVVPLLELGSGFNPEFTGLENIYFYNSIHGYSRKQTDAILDSILDFAEIGSFVHQPLKTYSSGMKARLAFAVSVNIDPDILILDEVLSVGDELFRRKCYAKMEEFFKAGKTILFVSHAVQSINELCTRSILLDKGECILQGPTKLVTMYYQKYLFSKQNDNLKLRLEIIELDKNELAKINYYESTESITEEKKNVTNKINLVTDKDEKIDIEKNFDEIRKFSTKHYIKNFVPKTTLVTGSNAVIENNFLIDENGLIVNILEFGKKYTMIFKTTFTDDAKNVRFGVQIKTVSGVIITGANTFDYANIILKRIKKGEEFIIFWKFHCLLQQGSYFTNIFADIDNQSNPTLILDSNIFKVECSTNLKFAGYVSLIDEIVYKKNI